MTRTSETHPSRPDPNRSGKPSLGKPSLGSLGRPVAAVRVRAEELVRESSLSEGQALPCVFEPATPGVDLLSWAAASRERVATTLLCHGAILFRGFAIDSPERFHQLLEALGYAALEYKERSSPRSQVQGNVYTSTDYPPQYPIFLHNENSYAHVWPRKILFCCQIAPAAGGETPIADVRRVYAAIPPAIRRKFEAEGVLYVRNFSAAAGLPWRTVFQTDDRARVEAYARDAGYLLEWRNGDRLRIRRRGGAAYRHPQTGEPVWFNHATFFHVSTLVPEIRQGLLAQFSEEDLPNQTYYGSGDSIEPEVLEVLRQAYDDATVTFPWQQGDVLLLDNMLVAHAREPFSGPRKILAAMAEATERSAMEPVR